MAQHRVAHFIRYWGPLTGDRDGRAGGRLGPPHRIRAGLGVSSRHQPGRHSRPSSEQVLTVATATWEVTSSPGVGAFADHVVRKRYARPVTKLSEEMLKAIDLDEIVKDELLPDTYSRYRLLAEELADDSAGAAAYQVLSAIAGMRLDGADWERPYSPLMTWGGDRTPLPGDLTDDALDFLRELLSRLSSSPLAARICDILFLTESEKAQRLALAQRYAEIVAGLPLLSEGDEEAIQTWARAAEIAGRFRFEESMHALATRALESFRAGSPVVAWHVAQAMRRARYFGDHADEVAERLDALGRAEPTAHARVPLFEESIRWRRGTDADKLAATTREAIGDAWWEEAKRRSDSSFLVRNFLGSAYSAYRMVPRSLRSERTRRRVGKLPRRIREAAELSLDEMQTIRSPLDLSPLIERAEAIPDIDDLIEALALWFAAVPIESFEDARAIAEESGVLNFVTNSTITDDARKVHSTDEERLRSGVSPSLWARMVSNYSRQVSAIAAGHIQPALMKFSTMYRLSIRDFEVIGSVSGFIPEDRKSLYARALHHGYYGRLTESLFILAPTLEACVRSVLQSSGVETRNVKSNDTEIEPGLSALMELPEADEVLGQDLAWNIRALFCGPTGPNLRNRVAHGLLDEVESRGGASLYAWWLAFLLAFTPYYRALRGDATGDESAQQPPAPDPE